MSPTTAPTVRRRCLGRVSSCRRPTRSRRRLTTQSPTPRQVVDVTRVDGEALVEQRPSRSRTAAQDATLLPGHREGRARPARSASGCGATCETVPGRRLELATGSSTSRSPSSRSPRCRSSAPSTLPQHQPTADGLNWAALAECESGGNPQAVNPAGPVLRRSTSSRCPPGSPSAASGCPPSISAAEQTYRAQLLYNRSGAGPWPVCGRNLFTQVTDDAPQADAAAALLGPVGRPCAGRPARHRGRPSSLGQNFVIDANTVRRIVRAAGVGPDDVVLEVGPGLGSLTLGLLAAVSRRSSRSRSTRCSPARCRRDRREARPPTYADSADSVVHGGRPAADPAARPAADRARRQPAVQRRRAGAAAPAGDPPVAPAGLVMVQAEVADRLAAPPGSKIVRRAVGQGGVVRRRTSGRRRGPHRLLAGAQRRLRAGRDGAPRAAGHDARAATRSSTWSTRPSRSAARRCGPRWPAGPARRPRPSRRCVAAGIDPSGPRRGARRDGVRPAGGAPPARVRGDHAARWRTSAT